MASGVSSLDRSQVSENPRGHQPFNTGPLMYNQWAWGRKVLWFQQFDRWESGEKPVSGPA